MAAEDQRFSFQAFSDRAQDTSERPVPSPACPCSPPVPQFNAANSPALDYFNVSKAEQVIKEMLIAQQNEARAAVNQTMQSLVGSAFKLQGRRKRKPARPQRSAEDDMLCQRSDCCAPVEVGPAKRFVASKGSKKVKKGMSADQALLAMQKIVKCRVLRPFQWRSSAFYKVYPVLFGHC
jgi:hypothetical protein